MYKIKNHNTCWALFLSLVWVKSPTLDYFVLFWYKFFSSEYLNLVLHEFTFSCSSSYITEPQYVNPFILCWLVHKMLSVFPEVCNLCSVWDHSHVKKWGHHMETFGVIDIFAQANMWSAFKQDLQIKVNSTTMDKILCSWKDCHWDHEVMLIAQFSTDHMGVFLDCPPVSDISLLTLLTDFGGFNWSTSCFI